MEAGPQDGAQLGLEDFRVVEAEADRAMLRNLNKKTITCLYL
jgi:hypothetical protein